MSDSEQRRVGAGTLARLGAVVRAEQEDQLLDEALARGLIGAHDLADACAAAENAVAPSAIAALLAKGRLSADDVAALEVALAQRAYERPSVARGSTVPPEVQAAAADPARHVGGFVLVARVGGGGAGEVWRAWDARHERWVAVKLATTMLETPGARERFEREARAAARLSHPNIVPVYQSGTEDGRPYIVMPLVDGAPLGGARLPIAQAVEIVRAAALAVDHAHQHGVVHRDLKPQNLILAPDGRVFVLDFGLAFLREEDGRVTRPGEVFGTAAYVAPEQTRGDAAAPGPATDIYGLGATLYHLVTGEPPFRGSSFAEIVSKVVADEPLPPSRHLPSLDKSLEAVIARAMAKQPRDRYPTAGALAEDLRRVLEHEQVSARPPTMWRRVTRACARHPGRVAVAAVAMSAVLAFAVRARQQAVQASAAAAVRDMSHLALDTALRLRRAGDLAGIRLVLPRAVAAYDGAREVGAISPEIDHAMGRLYRAAMDNEKALAFQDRALAVDPRHAPALYERAVLLAEQYGRVLAGELAWARGVRPGGGDQVPPPVRDELARLRQRILADCRALDASGLDEARARAARGIFALHERDFQKARRLLTDALARDPDREEGWLALASALEGLQRSHEAYAAYGEGLRRDRGFLPLVTGRCNLGARIGQRDQAIADANAALAMDPMQDDARICRAVARLHDAHDQMMKGQDATAAFDSAEADFGAVLARSPGRVVAAWGRGTLRRYRATARARHGGDSVALLDASEADYTQAVTFDPTAADCFTGRGRTRSVRGFHRLETGGDPRADFEDAERDFAQAHRLAPERGDLRDWWGQLRTRRALWRMATGASAGDDLERAAADYAAIAHQDPYTRLHEAALHRARATARLAQHQDPTPAWRQARALIDRAIADLAETPEPWVELATLEAERAAHGPAGERRRAALEAEKAARRAVAMDPRHRAARVALDRATALR